MTAAERKVIEEIVAEIEQHNAKCEDDRDTWDILLAVQTRLARML